MVEDGNAPKDARLYKSPGSYWPCSKSNDTSAGAGAGADGKKNASMKRAAYDSASIQPEASKPTSVSFLVLCLVSPD